MSRPRKKARTVGDPCPKGDPPLVCRFRCEPRPPYRSSYFSEEIEQLLGFPADRLVRESSLWYSRVHPQDRLVLPRCQSQLEIAGHTSVGARWRHKDSRYRRFHMELRLLGSIDGSPREIVGCLAEIRRGGAHL